MVRGGEIDTKLQTARNLHSCKAKVKLPLYLIRQQALNTYVSAAVQLCAFFASPLYVRDE